MCPFCSRGTTIVFIGFEGAAQCFYITSIYFVSDVMRMFFSREFVDLRSQRFVFVLDEVPDVPVK